MYEYGYVVNVDCAVARDGKYLLIRRSEQEAHAAGQWAFPGGKLEAAPGEDAAIERTARREVREETGVTVENVRYVHSTVFESDDGTRVCQIVTTADYVEGRARTREPEEVAAVAWRAPDAIRDASETPAFLTADVDRVERVRRG